MRPIWTLENGLLTCKAHPALRHKATTHFFTHCAHTQGTNCSEGRRQEQAGTVFITNLWNGCLAGFGTICRLRVLCTPLGCPWGLIRRNRQRPRRNCSELDREVSSNLIFFIIKSLSTLQSRRHFCMVKLDARDFEGFKICNLFTSPSLILPSPHLCLHPFFLLPIPHLMPLLTDYFSAKAFATTVPTPKQQNPKRKPGYQLPIIIFSSLVPFPKETSLLGVEELTAALSCVHAKIFSLQFALRSSGQPLHICSKALLSHYPPQVILSTKVLTCSHKQWEVLMEFPGKPSKGTAHLAHPPYPCEVLGFSKIYPGCF